MSARRLLGVFAVLAAGLVLLAARDLERPGLYYDETIQAATAAAFIRGEEPLALIGARRLELGGGRWLPWMTQPYLGALKTLALIPCLAVLGTDAVSLRVTTLAWGLVGLLLFLLWANDLAGPRVALASAALLAFDPSFLFSVRHDWGPFALGFACRMGGVLLLTRGWRRGSLTRLAAGGLLLGLAVYHKLDAVSFLAGCGLAAAAAAPRELWSGLRREPRRAVAAVAGLVAGMAPILPTLADLGTATLHGLSAGRAGLSKLDTWRAVLDGSYIYRAFQAGGRLEGLFSGEGAPHDLFGLLVVAAVLVGLLRERRRPGSEPERFALFALVALLAVGAILLAMPGATLMHHVLNAYPLPHLVAALALERLWQGGATRAAGRMRAAWRPALAAAVLVVVLASSLRLDLQTLEFVRATGGRGWWSDALDRLARELPPGTPVVSLDWGFAAPLRFAHPELAVHETVWQLSRSRRVVLEGDSSHVYLVHDRHYDALGFSVQLLAAARALPPEAVEIRPFRDREGTVAFFAIRFMRPHRLVHQHGSFTVEWLAPPGQAGLGSVAGARAAAR